MPSCLIVDDEPAVLQLVHRLLTRMGYRTAVAGSGTEAIALAERESFDVLLIDLRMPGPSGVETWERLKARGTIPRAVLMTAALEGPDLAAMYDMKFLAKPFDAGSLRTAVAEALAPSSDEVSRSS